MEPSDPRYEGGAGIIQYICLSSGAKERYRQDIVRILGLPWGTRLQFRYHRDYIGSVIRNLLDKGGQVYGQCLVAAIDQAVRESPPLVIPCRVGRIVSTATVGSTCALTIEAAGFALAEDLKQFNEALRNDVQRVPVWGAGEYPEGDYWLHLQQPLRFLKESGSLEDWEAIVKHLLLTESFKEEPIYYSVTEINEVTTGKKVRAKAGAYKLAGDREYEVQFYHFRPSGKSAGRFHLETTAGVNLVSRSDLIVDSSYDLKRARFATALQPQKTKALLAVYYEAGKPEGSSERKDEVWQFDLMFSVAGARLKTARLAFIIGALLTAPHAFGVLRLANVPFGEKLVNIIVGLVFNWAAAVAGAFLLKRPF